MLLNSQMHAQRAAGLLNLPALRERAPAIHIPGASELRPVWPRGAVVQTAGIGARPLRLTRGLLRLDRPGDDACPALLAWPGDVIGLEQLTGVLPQYSARCMVGCTLELLSPGAALDAVLLAQVLGQPQRVQDMLRLRSGSAPERVRELLVQMWRAAQRQQPGRELPGMELPTLEDMAAVTDSAVETVSRVISALGRSGELERLPGRQVRLAGALLDEDWSVRSGMTASRVNPSRRDRQPGEARSA